MTAWQAERGGLQPSAAIFRDLRLPGRPCLLKIDSTAFLNSTIGCGLQVPYVSLWRHFGPSDHVVPRFSRELALGYP